jgi:hypothetical protein
MASSALKLVPSWRAARSRVVQAQVAHATAAASCGWVIGWALAEPLDEDEWATCLD